MAASFAEAYRDRRWAAIYSSPLDRAVTTAQPLADAVGLPVQTRDGFAEIDYGASPRRQLDVHQMRRAARQ